MQHSLIVFSVCLKHRRCHEDSCMYLKLLGQTAITKPSLRRRGQSVSDENSHEGATGNSRPEADVETADASDCSKL
jgi:hypothetical protein